MEEVVRIKLDNEMDLILAHKRTMKIAELCGLSLSSQTTFATAVSEIARCAIGIGKNSFLVLGINFLRAGRKEINASILDSVDLNKINPDAFAYARRLIGNLEIFYANNEYEVRMSYRISFGGTISAAKIDSFKDYFKNEPPLSPYDEIRKKNIQLIDLSEKLQQSENQYKTLTDSLPLMMLTISPKETLIYTNKWLKDFLLSHNSIALNFPWKPIIHADDFSTVGQEWNRATTNRTPFRAQARLYHKDKNRYIWYLISIVPLKNDKDAVMSWNGFFVDIDAQKQVEETLKDNKELKVAQVRLQEYQLQLEEKINELNASNYDLEQFAYIASHDLQEPLRKIKTFTNLLDKNLSLGDKDRVYFNKIISSSERMSNLIRDVLNYSQLSSNNQLVKIELNNIVNDVIDDLELVIQDKGAILHVSKLPVVKGINLQLTQLFTNLITNSLKFSARAPVIRIEAQEASVSELEEQALNPLESFWKITVEDNGIGFEQQYAKQIFDIFQRLNDKQVYAGNGIGLALCKKIVANHRGSIKAEGTLSTGATFTIYLPNVTFEGK